MHCITIVISSDIPQGMVTDLARYIECCFIASDDGCRSVLILSIERKRVRGGDILTVAWSDYGDAMR